MIDMIYMVKSNSNTFEKTVSLLKTARLFFP
jgi:hypothetical protein